MVLKDVVIRMCYAELTDVVLRTVVLIDVMLKAIVLTAVVLKVWC